MAANPIVTLALAFLLIGLMLGPLLVLAGLKLWRLGKAFIVHVDADGRSVRTSYVRIKDGSFAIGEKQVLLDGRAKHGGKYSTWIVETATGYNLVAETRKESVERDAVRAVLTASNPESYFHAIRRNGWRNVLRAGEDSDKWKWVFPVALVGLIAILCTLFAVVYMLTKVGSVAGGAAGGIGG